MKKKDARALVKEYEEPAGRVGLELSVTGI
jgi:hypothetical protein